MTSVDDVRGAEERSEGGELNLRAKKVRDVQSEANEAL